MAFKKTIITFDLLNINLLFLVLVITSLFIVVTTPTLAMVFLIY